MPHTYHLTLTHLSDSRGEKIGKLACDFDFTSHDDLNVIIERALRNGVVSKGEVQEFCVGLKLLTEVVMKHRTEPGFAEFWPHLGTFIRSVKKPKSNEQA